MRSLIMESKESPQKQFEKECQHIYNALKKYFLDKMKEATDKEYAYNHYKYTLFEKNPSLYHNTIFFEELKTAFIHFRKLDHKKAIQLTLRSLPIIRKHSEEAHSQAFCVSYENPTFDVNELPLWYQNGINNDGCSLDNLMEQELKLSRLSEQEIIKILAFYQATQELLVDVTKFYVCELNDELPITNHKHQFTRSQIVIMAHYIFEMAGIDRNKVDITTCAEILHCMLGIPYDKISNSEIYKKMLKPFSTTSPKRTLEDLKLVRSYLAILSNQEILNSIDKQIMRMRK